nr:hypothetical protein [Moorella mulderi]
MALIMTSPGVGVNSVWALTGVGDTSGKARIIGGCGIEMGQGQPYIRPQLPKQQLQLTNLDKVFWPEGLTKLNLVEYYVDMAPVILPYLRDRPLVLKRYPDGITGEAFYQKECPAYAPEWVATLPVYHADSDKTINYVLCNNEATLAWLANQGCIERHATKVNRVGRRLMGRSAGRFFLFCWAKNTEGGSQCG